MYDSCHKYYNLIGHIVVSNLETYKFSKYSSCVGNAWLLGDAIYILNQLEASSNGSLETLRSLVAPSLRLRCYSLRPPGL